MKEELSQWVEQERCFRCFYYKKGQLRLYIAVTNRKI